MSKKVLVGRCGVDSGQIMITDPCYVIGEEFNDEHYEKVCDITLSEGRAGALPYEKGHEGKAVVASSGIGDGYYPVYATYDEMEDWGERITKLEIDFSDHPLLIEEEEEAELLEDDEDD